MKGNSLIIGLLFLPYSILFGQNNNESEAFLSVIYEMKWRFDTTQLDHYRKEDMLLLLGNGISMFESYNSYRFEYQLKHNKTNIQQWFGLNTAEYISSFDFHIYKEPAKNLITTTDHVLMEGCFVYEESMSDIVWNITCDTTTINNFAVQKATTSFGGREWTAWFTNDIPYSDGPYKFCGLPGLIIKLIDNKRHFFFQLQSIDKPEDGMLIDFNTTDCLRTTKKEFFRINRNVRQNIIGKARQAEIRSEDYSRIVGNLQSENIFIEADNL